MARKGEKTSEETKAKMRAAALGQKNHMYGKKLSSETKRKISLSNKGKHDYWKGKKQSPEMIAKRVEKLKIPCSEERKKKISIANKGKKRSEQCRKENSIRVSERYMSGWVPHAKSKWGKFNSKKCKKIIHLRSSYERRACEIFENDPKIIDFFSEHFRVPYVFNGLERIFIPDFLIIYDDGSKEVIEIKAKWCVSVLRNQEKFKYAKAFFSKINVKFSVWTEEELFNG